MSSENHATIHVEQDESLPEVLDALRAVLGPGAQLRAQRCRELLPASSGKFRLAYAETRAR